MSALASSGRSRDGRLWAIAFGLSLLANVLIVALVGVAAIRSRTTRLAQPATGPVPVETVMTILPELPGPTVTTSSAPVKAAPPPVPENTAPRFTRTSEDQTAPAPEKAAFIGERNTQATSDRAPDPTAPPLPSQAGIAPRHKDDFETTQSKYQDGRMSDGSPQKTAPTPADATPPPAPAPTIAEPSPEMASEKPKGERVPNPGIADANSTPPPPEKLLDGPNPVEVPVPKETAAEGEIKPTPAARKKDGAPPTKAGELPKPPAPPVNDPAFSGNQRKTAIVGSISRTGRSALNVEDTPLGRYQAIISRAVELEWQRNCVRYRDLITPGYLTVRFFIEPSGKVRTVQFVSEQAKSGEVQKGFTYNSIRDAEIPPMPASLKQDYSKQPLEVVLRFNFF